LQKDQGIYWAEVYWTDRWVAGQIISDLAPAMVAAVNSRAIKSLTVAAALPESAWIRGITGHYPISAPGLWRTMKQIDYRLLYACICGVPCVKDHVYLPIFLFHLNLSDYILRFSIITLYHTRGIRLLFHSGFWHYILNN
jgi:hypothetical protein